MLHAADAECRQIILRDLFRWAGIPPEARPTHRVLTADDLLALADGNLVEIGAHSVTHSRLGSLPGPTQQREIEHSKAFLEEVVERPVSSFAYPYGRPGDYTCDTMRMVRAAGFCCACANFSGVIDRSTDHYQLPRMYVHDWDGEKFERALAHWL